MKRCPDCNSLFNDADQFCELDGTPLVAAETAADGLVREKAAKVQESNSERSFLPLVGVIGVLIGALLFLVYFALFRERPREETNPSSSNVSTAQPPVTARPPQPRPVENASPSVEPSPSPSDDAVSDHPRRSKRGHLGARRRGAYDLRECPHG